MSWQRWLGFLGRLLPAPIRERVFEPACYDLAFEHPRARRSTLRLGLRIFTILVYFATTNFPRVLVEKRRPSRLGFLVASLALLSVVVLIIGIRITFHDLYAYS